MADRLHVEIAFEGVFPPTVPQLAELNAILAGLDQDIPVLTAAGMSGQWRSPIVELDLLLALIEACGFSCHGRMAMVSDNEAGLAGVAWCDSGPLTADADTIGLSGVMVERLKRMIDEAAVRRTQLLAVPKELEG